MFCGSLITCLYGVFTGNHYFSIRRVQDKWLRLDDVVSDLAESAFAGLFVMEKVKVFRVMQKQGDIYIYM